MKTIKKMELLLCTLTILSLTLFSCSKIKNETMTVVKNCTGVYLRFNNNDYRVCNLDKVYSFSDGATVKATLKKIDNCSDAGQSAFVCTMVHDNKGWINVEKIELK